MLTDKKLPEGSSNRQSSEENVKDADPLQGIESLLGLKEHFLLNQPHLGARV